MLTATKQWTCECGKCKDEKINPGDQFNIIEGTFYKEGHLPTDTFSVKKPIQISLQKPKIKLVLKKLL